MQSASLEQCESEAACHQSLVPFSEKVVKISASSRVAALEVSADGGKESLGELSPELAKRWPPLFSSAGNLRSRAGSARSSGSAALLSCIDNALRSLDEAITGDNEACTKLGSPSRAAAEKSKVAADTRPLIARVVARQPLSPVPAEDGRMRREALRRLSRLEPGTRWLHGALRSCIADRQAAALTCIARAASGRSRTVRARTSSSYAPSRLSGNLSRRWSHTSYVVANGPLVTAMPDMIEFALAVGRVVRQAERFACRSALSQWQHVCTVAPSQQRKLRLSLPGIEENDASCLSGDATPGTPGSVRRVVASIEQRQAVPGQLAAIEAENKWLRQAVHRERFVQRSLVQVALALQRIKADAFRTLRWHAVFQPWNACGSPLPALVRRGPSSASPTPAVEYAAQTRVISARWMGCVLGQAQLRLVGSAWGDMIVCSSRSHWHDHYGLGPDGLKQLCGGQREAWERLAGQECFEPRGSGFGFDASGSAQSCQAPPTWICCGVQT